MKILLVILTAVTVIQSCDDIKLIDSTSQNWQGGIPGVFGVNYRLTLIALRNSDELTVDQLWVKDEFYRVNGVKKLPARSVDGFAANDTIYIRATKVGTKADVSGVQKPRPEGIDEDWIIGYEINGKRKYIGTNAVRLLKTVFNP